MQVIGLCRFSYPAEGGFQVEHGSIEERMAYLYAAPRMEERLRHFECVCLPGLRAQTDPDFTFLILVGDAMPARWRDRLESLLDGFPQARIVARQPGPHRQVCQEVLNAARDTDRPCLQFRHDDDDAVAVDFVARLRKAAIDCAPLLRDHRLVGLDWNRGFIARPDERGLCAEETVTPYWGVAQALAVQPGVAQTILNFAHDRINRFMPTVTFTDRAMYVRGHNDHNDSRQKRHVKPVELPRLDPEGEALFRDLFAIDADHVRRIFGAG
ncbi:glycosyltransferase [Citreimonas salinaria]|uniref:Putative rhamnosyl transferase n=1 Tax=Citreimonas salinaria TaxID=321339 RepID=A0A1H3KFG9_9RHOB|nr:glycosyltransferase [Citreimonas salinaria]SDY50790.1 Putative rhamnosyl transferase [Citreimonas salinaria]